jgi:hypothetical protein
MKHETALRRLEMHKHLARNVKVPWKYGLRWEDDIKLIAITLGLIVNNKIVPTLCPPVD